jgi:chromosome segregation ATPase
MKTTSKEIEKELDQTTNRLDELTEMRARLNTNLQSLQKGFVGGKTSLDELQAEQGKLTILNESIKALEAKQDELHDAFQRAAMSESRAGTLEQMKTIAGQTEAAFNEYVNLRAELDQAIEQGGAKMVDALSLFRSKQREFEQAFRELAPGVINFRPVPAEARESFAQIKSELEDIGVSGDRLNFVTSTYQNLPKVEFAEIVGIIERFIGNGRFNAEQKQRQEARKAAKA